VSARAALLPLALFIAACGESTAAPSPITAIAIVPDSVEVVVNGTAQLRAAMWDAAGRAARDRAVTWTSSNPTVATVSPTGLVTTAFLGSTTITVTCEGRHATAVVVVFLPMGV
jgi:uncharacterized protein YjdB